MPIKTSASLIFLLAGLSISMYSTAAEDSMHDARQAIANEEYSTAIIHLKNQLKQTPKNTQARFLLGDVYLRTGKLDSGIKELGRAHEYAPDNTEILFRYAEVLQAAGKYKKIIKVLDKPLVDKQQESQRLSFLGYAHLRLKQLADAKQAFVEANQHQESARAFTGLASLAVIEQDRALAEQLLEKSLAIDPGNQSAIQLKAKLANLNKQHEQALTLYNQLIEHNSNNLSLYLERAATLSVLNKDEQAKADIKVVLDKVKNHPQANFIQAQILLRERDFAGAQAAAQQVVNAVPQNMPAALILGAANFGLKNYNQAEEYLTIYLAAYSSDIRAQNLLANVYLAQRKTRQALLILEGIPQEQRDADLMTLMTLGSTYIVTGNTKKGIELLSRAHTLAPDNLDIKKRLIAAQFQSGELDDAIVELEQLSTSDQAQNQTNYLLIISYIKQKQFKKAEEKISQLLTQTPDDSKLQNLNALIEQLKGNTEKAIALYQAIIKQDPANIPAYMGLARIAVIKENWQEAEKHFKQLIQINPNALKAYLGLAAIAEQQDKPQIAEQYFQDAIEQSKTNISSQLSIAALLSRWYQAKQQPEKILSLAETLDKQHPNDNRVRSFLASAQLLNQQPQRSERTLKSIITFDKNDIKHRILLAQLISQSPERMDEALSLLQDAQAIAPDNLAPYTLQIVLLIKQTRYEEAIGIAKDVQEKFPDSVTGKLLQADIYRAQKQYENALAIYQQVYQQQPDKKVLAVSVDILLLLKQRDKALAMLSQAIDRDPQDVDSLFKLASLHQESRQFEKAKEYYEQLLQIQPNHTLSLNNLAWIYLDGNINQAVELARRAHEQAPGSAAIADTYGYFLVRDGQHQQGLDLLQQAASDIPEDNDIQYHLALAYEKNGQRDKALDILSLIVAAKKPYIESENAKLLYQEIK